MLHNARIEPVPYTEPPADMPESESEYGMRAKERRARLNAQLKGEVEQDMEVEEYETPETNKYIVRNISTIHSLRAKLRWTRKNGSPSDIVAAETAVDSWVKSNPNLAERRKLGLDEDGYPPNTTFKRTRARSSGSQIQGTINQFNDILGDTNLSSSERANLLLKKADLVALLVQHNAR